MITPCEFSIDDNGLSGMIKDYYVAGASLFDTSLDKAYGMDKYGYKDTGKSYDVLNNFHYILFLFIIIYYERENDEAKGINRSIEYYYDKYSLDCIRKKMFCEGYNIRLLLESFILWPY